jgi:hypothetical protein
MHERIIGYILLAVGICMMWYTVLQVFLLLTNQIKPFSVFQNTSKSTVQSPNKALTQEEVMMNPAGAQQAQANMFSDIIEKQTSKSINLGATMFFYYFLMLFGFRLASLGTQLIRPINVKLRGNVVDLEDHKPDQSKPSPPPTK